MARKPSRLELAWTAGRIASRRVLGRKDGAKDLELGTLLSGQLDEVKGLAMKVGQIVSYMDVPLPESVQQQLARLQHGVLFALVPSQAPAVAVVMGVGCVMLVAGTVALGRGRTAGLLLNLVGAIVIGCGVTFAPWISPVATANPWLPNAGAFLPIVLGLCAATCAAVSTALYAVPLLRFVARRSD